MKRIHYLSSISDPAAYGYRSLKETHGNTGDFFVAETRTVILNALSCGCRPVSFLMEQKYISGRDADILAQCPDVPVYTSDHKTLEKITGFSLTRGILSLMRRPKQKTLEEITNGSLRICVLSNVQDASNTGAIIRSAAALGMDGMLLTKDCCDPLHRKSIRTSTGGVFRFPWAKVGYNGTELVETLKKTGFITAALALDSRSVPLGKETSIDRSRPLALFLGSEGNGLTPETVAACDITLKIPMRHGSDSLNVAAAAAIAFYEYSL